MRPVMSRLLWPLSYGPGRMVEHIPARVRCASLSHGLRCRPVKARLLLGITLASAFAARADVVDLSRGGRRSETDLSGFSVRAEFGNDYAPYGLVGAAVSYLTSSGTAFEAGAGGRFPGGPLRVGVGQALRA